MSDVRLENRNLRQVMKALKTMPVAKIGILADSGKNPRKGEDAPNNATVGAAHEYGTSRLPVRSFLRQPLSENLERFLEASDAFSKQALAEVVRLGTMRPWMEKMAIVAEEVVAGAFDTGGYGQWQPSDMTNKTNYQTLVETTQLRDSITSEVTGG